jgi:hydrogenase maturation protein HypF
VTAGSDRGRRAVEVVGVVQGVGFRPFVHSLAEQLGLSGFVRNAGGSVVIEIEGRSTSLDVFLDRLRRDAPALARIEDVRAESLPPSGQAGFAIVESDRSAQHDVAIAPDASTCEACLRELFDPADRRHGYAFINCTDCGPRLTIVTGAPYDRARTTMAGFPLCAACDEEYRSPRNRRFHAEPIACPECGPKLHLEGPATRDVVLDPIDAAAAVLVSGGIVAVKGIGGFHLACDAGSEEAVRELRRRKVRDAKPFALMVRDLEAARSLAHVSEAEARALGASHRPIVLLRRREEAELATEIAPGMETLGVMLPYAPIHHLLFDRVKRPLVMTSGNRSDEPIVFRDDDEARVALASLSDAILSHDRPISIRCDDSVVREVAGRTVPLRRGRGLSPLSLSLGEPLRLRTLAVGGDFKSVFAIGSRSTAIVGHHLGDLDHVEARRAQREAIAHYADLHRLSIERIVHDGHPDYVSTSVAHDLARELGVPTASVQHHHAHMASSLAEHRLHGPAIGVVFDGSGRGLDGASWGGEIFVGTRSRVVRAAHLAYVPLPGGDRASRQPWRMAVSHLVAARAWTGQEAFLRGVPSGLLRGVLQLLDRPHLAPPTSSVGRLFDAAAAIVGVANESSFEGHAPMLLESLASRSHVEPGVGYPFDLRQREGEPWQLDPGPLLGALLVDVERGARPEDCARRFHRTVARMVEACCVRLARLHHTSDVVLAGGVFVNAILLEDVCALLERAGLRPHVNQLVPPNDGGLAVGQLAVTAALDAEEVLACA